VCLKIGSTLFGHHFDGGCVCEEERMRLLSVITQYEVGHTFENGYAYRARRDRLGMMTVIKFPACSAVVTMVTVVGLN
jgi:hypothetical protein